MKIAIICCLLAICICMAVAKNVPCESFRLYDDWTFGLQKTCFMNGTTVIDLPKVLISSTADASVKVLFFWGNEKIKFLPENPAKKFANLILYHATSCSIETITKENFNDLSKLKKIRLMYNKIEKVPNDVFEDLTALEILYLDYNKIKFINNAAFRGLSNLRDIDFNGNVCVQGRYESATSITSMIPTLTDKCGFSEDSFLDDFARKTSDQVNKISEAIASNRKEQQQQANTSNYLIREIEAEIVKFRDENSESCARIESELKAAKAQIGQLQTQVQEMNLKLAESEKKQTENALKMDKLQQTLDDAEMKTKFEQMETLMKTAVVQKQELIEKFQTQVQNLNDEMTKEREASKLQATECKMEKEMLNKQLNESTHAMKSEQAAHQVENGKNLMKISEQSNTIETLTAESEELDQCKRDKIKFRDDFRSSNSKLQVYEDIDIARLREEMRSAIDLLRKTAKP